MLQKVFFYISKHNNKISCESTYQTDVLLLYHRLCIITIVVLAYFQPFRFLLIHSHFSLTKSGNPGYQASISNTHTHTHTHIHTFTHPSYTLLPIGETHICSFFFKIIIYIFL